MQSETNVSAGILVAIPQEHMRTRPGCYFVLQNISHRKNANMILCIVLCLLNSCNYSVPPAPIIWLFQCRVLNQNPLVHERYSLMKRWGSFETNMDYSPQVWFENFCLREYVFHTFCPSPPPSQCPSLKPGNCNVSVDLCQKRGNEYQLDVPLQT